MSSSLIGPPTIAQMCALAAGMPPGVFVEFGVYKGGSARALADVAEAQGRALHLFDTFTGMPVAGPGDSHKVGDFADTDEAAVRALIPSAVFHVGVFPATFPPDLPGIAFAHIDADQYQCILDAIDLFGPRMVPGGVMWFDDCGALPSADRAVLERLADRVDRASFDKWIVRY
jgi:hypothetical protein